MVIREHVALAELTTFKVGGDARYFAEATNEDGVRALFQFARSKTLPVFILGGGSNILIDDLGFSGLVLKVEIGGISFEENNDDVLVTVGAGVIWDDLVAEAVARGYWGLENLSLIPGTVGGALVQNIGAYGSEVSEVVEWVNVYDEEKENTMRLSRNECTFGYRNSVFKHVDKQLVIIEAQFRLHKNAVPRIGYKDIANYFHELHIMEPTLAQVRDAVVAIRTKKLPPLSHVGTAGSFFKNPVLERTRAEELIKKYPTIPVTNLNDGTIKLSSAWIIDNILQMKGERRGHVGCWGEQALVIVNYGGASADEIKNFVYEIQKKCLDMTGITLEREVIFVSEK